jgi:catalase
MVTHFYKADKAYGEGVAIGLGLRWKYLAPQEVPFVRPMARKPY